jgi:hypothetical protein
MNHRDSTTHGVGAYGIIPPYILEAIVRNGTASQRAAARQTLALDAQIRTQRATRPMARSTWIEAAVARLHRLIYSAGNTGGLPGTLIRSEGQGPSGDISVDEAYDYLGATFDLYWDVYKRNSIDNNGRDLIATVHYLSLYNNAFWNGTQMVFGDGDPTIFNRFTLAIDVAGHELTHGVVAATAGLEYHDQPGALNESVCDVFGSLVKQRLLGQSADQADWLIGAGMFAPGINGVALRSMRAPGTAYHDPLFASPLRPDGKDPQPDHMSRYVNLPNDAGHDWGGVHINSGIPNKAFFLVATALGGNAWDVAGNIWYRTLLDSRLSATAQFQDFATLTAVIANERYGASVRTAVVQAWHEVGIAGDPLHIERSRPFGAPKAVGAPSGIVFPALGVTDVVYRDAQGRLHELWQQGSESGTSNLTQLAGNATRAAGDPRPYIATTDGLLVALYRGTDGHVHSLYWSTGPVGHDALSRTAGAPRAAGNPAGYVQKDGTNVVIYRSGDGHLHSLWWTGTNAPVTEDLTAPSGATPAAGDPAPYINTNTGENIVAYRGTDKHIHTMYWTTGAVGHDDLSGFAGSPQAAGDPVAYYTGHNDAHQVTYRSRNGHLHELWWVGNNPVSGWDLTAAAAGAPPAASNPAVYYIAGNNTKHVIYRSANGHLNEIWWIPGGGIPAHVDVTLAAFAPLAVDVPSAFTVVGPDSQHVIFRGTDGQIHEIRWN